MLNDRDEAAAAAGLQTFEERIGIAAGQVWRTLKLNGAMSWQQISKVTGLAPDTVHRGIGWLAREGKLLVDARKLAGEFLRLK